MSKKIKLTKEIKTKLSEAVELWADDNLNGKPLLLATILYQALEDTMISKIKVINEKFK